MEKKILGESDLSREERAKRFLKPLYENAVDVLDKLLSDVIVKDGIDWEDEYNSISDERRKEIEGLLTAKMCVESVIDIL